MASVYALAAVLALQSANAQEVAPLTLAGVARAAYAHRAEIAAARARAEALTERSAIVGALEDPMVSASVDHYPFDMMAEEEGGPRYDWSVAIEQRLPLSGVLGRRRAAADADAARARADAERIALDVVLEAQRAFFMLRERRRMADVLAQQLELARELIDSAAARYAAGTGPQADVLRSEVERARLEATRRALGAQTRAAQAMLNVSMGRPAAAEIGPLEDPVAPDEPPPGEALQAAALEARPELRAGEAEIERAAAEIEVMRSMYRPMAMLRAGRATTMAEGEGAMLMVGVSVPLWRKRLRAGVAEARAMERMARADLEAMQRMIEGEIADARAQVESASSTRHALESDVVPRAQMAVDAALAAYASGQGALVAAVESSRALWEARSELIMAETTLGEARVRLERAVGNPPTAEVIP